VTVNR